MVPAVANGRLRRHQPYFGSRLDVDTAAAGNSRQGNGAPGQAHWLMRISHEFGDGPERTEAPVCLGIGDLLGEQCERQCWIGHWLLP